MRSMRQENREKEKAAGKVVGAHGFVNAGKMQRLYDMPVTWSSPPGGQDFPLRGSSDGSKASLVTHSPSFLMCVLAACHCCHMLRLLASNADAMEPADVGIDGSSGDESTSCVAIDGSGDDEAVDSGSDGSGDERSRASTTSDESSEGSVSSGRSGGGGGLSDKAHHKGRPSTYYVDIPIPPLPGERVVVCACWAIKSMLLLSFFIESVVNIDRSVVLDTPDDLRVAGAPYLGPELLIDLDSC
ncbi:hypothetical protein BHM03_00004672 [Ensete ventricosum]|nr:hypothetical protein BHM03_00004672 [Ensete ventricosum]